VDSVPVIVAVVHLLFSHTKRFPVQYVDGCESSCMTRTITLLWLTLGQIQLLHECWGFVSLAIERLFRS
jgi:hypothetical protein